MTSKMPVWVNCCNDNSSVRGRIVSMAAGAIGALLICGSASRAAIVVHSDDSTTDANWRTAAALESDNEYGTDGYVLYGWNATPATFYNQTWDASSAAAGQETSLPSYITDVVSNSANQLHSLWSGNGNYGFLQNPNNPMITQQAGVLIPFSNTHEDPMSFTLHRANSTPFRLTLLIASGDLPSHVQNIDVDAGSAGSVSTSHTGLSFVGMGYKSFDIGAGTDAILVTITGTAGENTHLTGFAFDSQPIPEPSSIILAVLGLIGLVAMARRRT